jgi:hypothetical protein
MSTHDHPVVESSGPSSRHFKLMVLAVAGPLFGISVALWFTTDGTYDGEVWLRSDLGVLAASFTGGCALSLWGSSQRLGKVVLVGTLCSLVFQAVLLFAFGFFLTITIGS